MRNSRLIGFITGLLLALVCAAATGQAYIPLQPAHSGHWYHAGANGEGIHLDVFEADHGPVVWAAVYGIEGDRDFWSTAIESTHDSWQGNCTGCPREYLLHLFQRRALNGEPELEGFLHLRPTVTGIQVRWHVVRDEFASHRPDDRFFTQLTRPTPGGAGHCGTWTGPFPAPPPADPIWCH